jgi:hypothetical protein
MKDILPKRCEWYHAQELVPSDDPEEEMEVVHYVTDNRFDPNIMAEADEDYIKSMCHGDVGQVVSIRPLSDEELTKIAVHHPEFRDRWGGQLNIYKKKQEGGFFRYELDSWDEP